MQIVLKHAEVICDECGHKQMMERQVVVAKDSERPLLKLIHFHCVCHECETVLSVGNGELCHCDELASAPLPLPNWLEKLK